MRRVENRFTVTYGHAQPNANKEALYAQHKARFKGFIHNTLSEYLSAGFQGTVFDTREVCVYDGDRLIAVSYFDLGDQSMASLLGLYDEAYGKYSLGTYTLLKEAEYGKRTDGSGSTRGTSWTNNPTSTTSSSLGRWSTTPPTNDGRSWRISSLRRRRPSKSAKPRKR